jgi:nucleotide-binding universal stress UspA family protein
MQLDIGLDTLADLADNLSGRGLSPPGTCVHLFVRRAHSPRSERPYDVFLPSCTDPRRGDFGEASAAAVAFAGRLASRFGATLTAGAAVTTRVVDGPAIDAVLGAAGDTDLVVVGTHGRRGAATMVAGLDRRAGRPRSAGARAGRN